MKQGYTSLMIAVFSIKAVTTYSLPWTHRDLTRDEYLKGA